MDSESEQFNFLSYYKEKIDLADFHGLQIDVCNIDEIKIVSVDDDYTQHLHEQGIEPCWSHARVKKESRKAMNKAKEARRKHQLGDKINKLIFRKNDFDTSQRHMKRPYIGPLFTVTIPISVPPNNEIKTEKVKIYVPCSSIKFEGDDCEEAKPNDILKRAKHFNIKLSGSDNEERTFAKYHSYRPFIDVDTLIDSLKKCLDFNVNLALNKNINIKETLLEAVEVLCMIPVPDCCVHEYQLNPIKIEEAKQQLNSLEKKYKSGNIEEKEYLSIKNNLIKSIEDPDIREPRNDEKIRNDDKKYTDKMYKHNISNIKKLRSILLPQPNEPNFQKENSHGIIKELQDLCMQIFQEQECLLATGKFIEEKDGEMSSEERSDKIGLMFNMTGHKHTDEIDTSDSSKLNGTNFIHAIVECTLSTPYFEAERELNKQNKSAKKSMNSPKQVLTNEYLKIRDKVKSLMEQLTDPQSTIRDNRVKDIIRNQKEPKINLKLENEGPNKSDPDDPPHG